MAWIYKIARKVWEWAKWITSSVLILYLVTYAANVSVLQENDVSSTVLIRFIKKLFLPGFPQILTVSALAFLVFITLLARIFVAIEKHTEKGQPALTQVERWRRWLLAEVKRIWIAGVLEHDLHTRVSISLALQERPSDIMPPRRDPLHVPTNQIASLLSKTRVADLYNQANGELLILGKPGVGKTRLLLELARDLLTAASDDTHTIPVVLRLSSWAVKRHPFETWLVKELEDKYQIPSNIAHSWVDENELLLLLDGLDEMASDHQIACVQAINAYREKHAMIPIVVSSESEEYRKHKNRLTLNKAVEIATLTPTQIETCLEEAGGELALIRVALPKDAELRKLVQTPLMLTILIEAFQDMPMMDILASGSLKMRHQRVFSRYIEKRLQNRPHPHFTAQKTVDWLKWLAQQLKQRNQTEFYIEQLQPSWLDKHASHEIALFVIGSLIVGLPIALGGFIVEGFNGAIYGITGPLGWWIFTSLADLVAGDWGDSIDNIRLTEGLEWSWMRFKKYLGTILVPSVIGGFVSGFLLTRKFGFVDQLIIGLMLSVLFVVLYGLIMGASREPLDERRFVKANQGLRRSATRSILFGVLISTATILSGILINVINNNASFIQVAFIGFGVAGGILAALTFGGTACIRHVVLRVFLWKRKSIPLNYPGFLEYAAGCFSLILHKVGGGYVIHRELRDYFAGDNKEPVYEDTKRQVEEPLSTSQEGVAQKRPGTAAVKHPVVNNRQSNKGKNKPRRRR